MRPVVVLAIGVGVTCAGWAVIPRSFVSRATLLLEFDGSVPESLARLTPAEIAERWKKTLFDPAHPKGVGACSEETDPGRRATCVAQRVELTSQSDVAYALELKDAHTDGLQKTTAALALLLVELAPAAFGVADGPAPPTSPEEADALRRLAEFVTAHPELARLSGDSPDSLTKRVAALRREQKLVQAQLARVEARFDPSAARLPGAPAPDVNAPSEAAAEATASASDNAEPTPAPAEASATNAGAVDANLERADGEAERKALRAKLRDLEASSRREEKELAQLAVPGVAPAVLAEWQGLVAKLHQTPIAKQSAPSNYDPPWARARVIATASAPQDTSAVLRHLWLGIALALTTLTTAGVAWSRRLSERRYSSRPAIPSSRRSAALEAPLLDAPGEPDAPSSRAPASNRAASNALATTVASSPSSSVADDDAADATQAPHTEVVSSARSPRAFDSTRTMGSADDAADAASSPSSAPKGPSETLQTRLERARALPARSSGSTRPSESAGRYSYSSRAPKDESIAPEQIRLPGPPRLPEETTRSIPASLSKTVVAAGGIPAHAAKGASESPAATTSNAPASAASPLAPRDATSSAPPPSEGPRTERGLGIPTRPPSASVEDDSDWQSTTSVGIGRLKPSSRSGSPSSSRIPIGKQTLRIGSSFPPSAADFEAEIARRRLEPESERGRRPRDSERSFPTVPPRFGENTPESSRSGALPLRVTKTRSTWRPPAASALGLKAVHDDLVAAAERSSHVVLLSGAASAAPLLARTALELAARLGPVISGRVLVTEVDFERPLLSELLEVEVPYGQGFSQQLHEWIHKNSIDEWTVLDTGLGFHFLGEGRIRSPGLLWSVQFPEAIRELRRHYRTIVVVAPRTMTEVDKRALDDVTDDVVVITDPAHGGTPLGTGLLANKVSRTVAIEAAQRR